MKLIIRIILTIIALPCIVCYPPLWIKILFPNYWKKMKELAKKQYEIEKAKIEKEYEKLKKDNHEKNK